MDTAAAVPAPWPVTVQAIMFLIAAWLANSKSVLSHVTNERPVLYQSTNESRPGSVPGHGPARHQQVVDPGRDAAAVGDLEVAAGARQDQDVVPGIGTQG